MINDRVRKILAGVRKQEIPQGEGGMANRFFSIESGMAIFDQALSEGDEKDFRLTLDEAARNFTAPETGARLVGFGGFRIKRVGRYG